MGVILITGSSGLIGSEAARFYCSIGFQVIGIDNDMRAKFFGKDASTKWNREYLKNTFSNYIHYDIDIRNEESVKKIFQKFGKEISLIIHAASQPSHDWAANDPFTDFTINANATLLLLEMTREYSPETVFIFTSTNKVYGDTPNLLPLIEKETRWEIDAKHKYCKNGIDEEMSIDQSKHSLFGVSKTAGDLLVQEYGRYFGIRSVCFRGGCLTGPSHSGTQLHGFLSYLMKCCITGKEYTIFGYKGKQVRDNIHSSDLIFAFDTYFKNPRISEVYNIGGGRFSNCSMIEAIEICEEISLKKLKYKYVEDNRIGDHIWWISDNSKFKNHFPSWDLKYDLKKILQEIYDINKERWSE
ncbi:MAG: NAD-dependent epimerase [Ignavibacteriales bacterium UTCHB2]|nr:MAG: NAD-dependent epimerase [Ignavibacteriales bacterium UTCHB2]